MNRLPTFFVIFLLLTGALLSATVFSKTYNFDQISVEASRDDSLLVNYILTDFYASIETFQQKIGWYPDLAVNIKIAASQAEFLELAKTNTSIIHKANAFYDLQNKCIVLHHPRNKPIFHKIRRILMHEFIHLYVDAKWENAPLWFHEGMAVYYSGGLAWHQEYLYLTSYLFKNNLHLSKMRSAYPQNEITWELFYAHSASTVHFLSKFHKDNWQRFWDNSNPNWDTAFHQSFLLNEKSLEKLLTRHNSYSLWLVALVFVSSLIGLLMPLLLIIAWLRRMYKNMLYARAEKAELLAADSHDNSDENDDGKASLNID